MASNSVTIKILGDASSAKRSFAEVENSAGGFGSKMASFGKMAAAGFAVAGTAVAAFGAKALMAASDLNETLSKTQIVFGQATKQVTGFADDMAKKFGLPKTQILDAASSIGLIGKASGLAQGDAAKMSTELAGLAADASSFYNVPLEEALMAIQSGLVGEAEPMRRFGVLLNEAAVKSEALALGLAKQGDELTEGQKAQARASLIMKGMKDASGDLERTQGSLSNRLRELKGRAENFSAAIGSKLLPLALKAFDLFEKWGPVIQQKLAPAFKAASGFVQTLFSGMTEQDTATGFEKVALAVRDIIVNKVIPAFKAISGWWAANGPSIMAAVGRVVAFVVGVFDRVKPSLQRLFVSFQTTFADIMSKGDQFREAISHIWNFLKGLWQIVGDDILRQVSRAFHVISAVISGVMQVIRGVIQTVLAIINGDWGKAWNGIKTILAGVWNAIFALLAGALGTVKSVLAIGVGVIAAIWGKAWDGIKGAFGAVWDGIKSIAVGAVNFMTQNVINPLIRGLNLLITGFNRLPGVPNLPMIAEIARIASGSRGSDTSVSLGGGVRAMAEGGFGTVSSPTLFLAGEAGKEDYAFGPHSKGGLGGTGQTVTIYNTINMPPGSDGQDVVDAITRWERRNGKLYARA